MSFKKWITGVMLVGCVTVGMLIPTALADETPQNHPSQQYSYAVGAKQMSDNPAYTRTKLVVSEDGEKYEGYSYSYVYDNKDRVRVMLQSRFYYDDLGREILYPNDLVKYYYTYNSDNQIVKEDYRDMAHPDENYTSVRTYTGSGTPKQDVVTYVSGDKLTVTYTCDNNGNVIKESIRNLNTNESSIQYLYSYDSKNRRLGMTAIIMGTTYETKYYYDDLGNISYAMEEGVIRADYTYQKISEYRAQNPVHPADIFDDVKNTRWSAKYIANAYVYGLMNGSSMNIFDPSGKMNRAMFVQVLYNAANTPAVTKKCQFSDVKEGSWYYNAVAWAQDKGITNGTGNGKFSPTANITREQLVTMLYNYVKPMGQFNGASGFADSNSVSGWAKQSVGWAVKTGIISGTVDSKGSAFLNPKSIATREEAATILSRHFVK